MPTFSSDYKYWAFVSYSHTDSAWGEWLHRGLETYPFPRSMVGLSTMREHGVPSRFYPVFLDRKELPTSGSLGDMINKALLESRYLIVLGTPRSAQSRWVNQEVLEFQRLGRCDRIVCVILEGEPHADMPERECLPPALRDEQASSATLLDARGLRREAVLLRLLAVLSGVGEERLHAAGVKRKRERTAITLAASLALVAVMGTLAASALASEQIAKSELAKATRMKKFVVSIFNGIDPAAAKDLDKSQARALLDAGAARMAELDSQPLVQADLQNEIGVSYESIGLYQEAYAQAESSYELRARTLGPEESDTIDSLKNVAVTLDDEGKYSDAEKLERKVVDIQSRVFGKENDDTLESMNNLATSLCTQGKYPEAESLWRQVIAGETRVAPSLRPRPTRSRRMAHCP